jgi:hypothetical protein
VKIHFGKRFTNIIFCFSGYSMGKSLTSLEGLRYGVSHWEVRLCIGSCEFRKDEVLARISVE